MSDSMTERAIKIDALFEEVDDLLCDGDFDVVDKMLLDADPHKLGTLMTLGMLSSTLPTFPNKNRPAFVERARAYIQRQDPDRVDALMSGLEHQN